jgi:hypothetical protein
MSDDEKVMKRDDATLKTGNDKLKNYITLINEGEVRNTI